MRILRAANPPRRETDSGGASFGLGLEIAAPPDGSRGSRSAPGSRRLSHIRQIAEFSLPCLGVYHWLRTRVTLTPATFRLPHPRPSFGAATALRQENACRRNTPAASARSVADWERRHLGGVVNSHLQRGKSAAISSAP
ncbi:MAG: hypothetical protein IKU71_01490 [Kiritimatiellae bacterium]|nr:hypothetical protein [Kiritimatiellia bacterium]